MNTRKISPARRFLVACFLAGTFLSATGNAQQTVSISSPPGGPKKIYFLVQAGKAVKKGEALVVFDPEAEIQALQAAGTAVREAETKVRGMETDLSALSAGLEPRRKTLEADRKEAALALERWQQVDQPLTEKRLQQAVTDADAALRSEQEHCNSRDELLKQGAIRRSEWEEAGLKLERAKLAAETARANLDAHLKYEKGPQTDKLTDVLHQKEVALKALQTDFDASKAAMETGLAAAKARCAGLQAAEARRQEQLNQTALPAPSDGIFQPAAESGSDSKLAPGSEVVEGQLLGTIGAK